MRRDQIILLLQPYKNGLMPKKSLSASSTLFARGILDLCERYPRLRFNIALPGYILESIDPLVLSSLRGMVKRGSVEWLCMGYTEPFLSFSPLWLTRENIALGSRIFSELSGEAPLGFVPPFSNWEPSHIDMLGALGLRYAVVSNALLAEGAAQGGGYWITEHTGSSMAVFPARSYSSASAPADPAGWIRESFPDDAAEGAPRMIVIKYMYSLEEPSAERERAWIEGAAAELDRRILEIHSTRFKDVVGNAPPLGLHYFPPSLIPPGAGPITPYFLNYLHCYDQISVMQRKLMDVGDALRAVKAARLAARLMRSLFFAQDINRFLPRDGAGFAYMPDRLWTYGKLIEIERELYGLKGAQGGVIRLSDFLRNGYKSVIMANSALKLYIDHKNGAMAYELDYLERGYNACAAYNPATRALPSVITPSVGRLGFRDRIFAGKAECRDYLAGRARDCANFSGLPFEYTFKNSPGGVRVLLNCNGGFVADGRQCPLTIDKVFGLEKESPALSYSYKLGNPSLTGYSFTFGIELPLALPGASSGNATLSGGKKELPISAKEPVTLEGVSAWEIDDEEAGVRMSFVTQKSVDVWLFCEPQPGGQSQKQPGQQKSSKNKRAQKDGDGDEGGDTHGAILLITSLVEIEQNSTHAFTGKVLFKKIKARGAADDTL